MQTPNPTFPNAAALETHLSAHGKSVFVTEMICDAYPGMVLYAGLGFDASAGEFLLNLEWMSYGLDYSGEDWQQSYQYASATLSPLLTYLYESHGIEVKDIPFRSPQSDLPNPREASRLPEYEAGWDRFFADFQQGKFRAAGLSVVYSDEGRPFLKPGA